MTAMETAWMDVPPLLTARICCGQAESRRGPSSATWQAAGEGCSGGRSQCHAHSHLPDHCAAGMLFMEPQKALIVHPNMLSMAVCSGCHGSLPVLLWCLRTVQPAHMCLMCVAAVQGIVGSTPWNAMVFFTLWLQLLGFSDFAAALLMAVFAGGCAIGSLIGGNLGAAQHHLSYVLETHVVFEVLASNAMCTLHRPPFRK